MSICLLQNFGGNIDNRRIGKGATMYYPIQVGVCSHASGRPSRSTLLLIYNLYYVCVFNRWNMQMDVQVADSQNTTSRGWQSTRQCLQVAFCKKSSRGA